MPFDLNDKKLIKKTVIDNLEKAFGNISAACKSVNISRQCFYDWMDIDKDFKKAVDKVFEIAPKMEGDFVKSKLMKLINNEHPAAIIFYCKTKLRNEGYSERLEITGRDGGSLKTESSIDYKKLNNSELKVLQDLLEKAQKLKE